jgi:acetyl-CoA carboxylase carboxyltransferase component
MSWEERMRDFEARREHARGMGGPERLARRRAEGRLNARERIDRLADAGSFMELGTFNVSDMPGDEERTPADSKVAGLAAVDGRPVAISSNDFTVMAATSSRVASHKESELKALATRRGLPSSISPRQGARVCPTSWARRASRPSETRPTTARGGARCPC